MLSEQPISPAGYAEAMRVIKRLDRQITFSIQTDRSVAQIRRANSRQLIVHDQNFRMDQHLARSVSSLYYRIVDAKSVVPISAANVADEAIAIGAHHKTFKQSRRKSSHDRDDFGSVLGGKTPRQKPPDIAGGEILRLNIN